MTTNRIRFTVAYDGTDYCGWQRQNHDSRPSLCQTIQQGLEDVFNEPIALFASGRTDAGVHALNQVCHFDTTRKTDRLTNWDFCWSMKSRLPPSITVKRAWLAPKDFHATLSASHKTYRYFISNRPRRSPFLQRYADWMRRPMDLAHLNASSSFLIGKQDFSSFKSMGSQASHGVREIYKVDWRQRGPDLVQMTITGSGFLKQMVRNIVGTVLFLERRGESPEKMSQILLACDRRAAGPAAPPQGLFLMQVYYPKALDNRCLEI